MSQPNKEVHSMSIYSCFQSTNSYWVGVHKLGSMRDNSEAISLKRILHQTHWFFFIHIFLLAYSPFHTKKNSMNMIDVQMQHILQLLDDFFCEWGTYSKTRNHISLHDSAAHLRLRSYNHWNLDTVQSICYIVLSSEFSEAQLQADSAAC